MDLPISKYTQDHQVRAFFQEAQEKAQALPGAQFAGFISHRLILGGEPSQTFTISGRPKPEPADTPWAATITVTPGVFSVFRIPLLQGRLLSAEDSETSSRVAVISRSAAERYWPEDNPIAAQIRNW